MLTNIFFEKLDSHVDSAFPETYKMHTNESIQVKPWISSALLVSRKSKLKLASLRLRKPNLENINKYKTYNSIYNKTVRRAKQIYYASRFNDCSANLKKTWETIREVLGRQKNKQNIPDFFRNGNVIKSSAENISEGFNSFFSKIGPELANKIPTSNNCFSSFLGPTNQNNFVFGQVTPELVTDIVNKLQNKTSCGPDHISPKLLKLILPLIIQPLCHLFNLSFQTGFMPP